MTHSEKFQQLTVIYPEIFIDEISFSQKLGNKRPTTVNNWMKGTSPNTTGRAKICQIFGLKADIWIESFNSIKSFKRRVESGEFKIIVKDKKVYHKIENIIFKKETIMNEEENPSSMFEKAKRLKNEQKIDEALDMLREIEENPSSYKYTYHNQIEHLKAILLSHESIQEWDRAIDILKRLYSGSKYHLEEPEIITLIASNYKRKALREEGIDRDLLVNALTLYKEAYNLKENQAKYYDAINYAYLYTIIDAIEKEYANPKEIEELYEELKKVWRVDDQNWWEVSSEAEFLMLLGQVDLAISKINDYLDFNLEYLTPFEIETTMRQIKLYIEFSDNNRAKIFYNHLEESWKSLSSL